MFKETEKGVWTWALVRDVEMVFEKVNLGKYSQFLDLGSGDGRVVMAASLHTNAIGIEYDRELHGKAEMLQKRLGANCVLYNDDFMDRDLSKFDCIFINPDKPFDRGMEDKLKNEFSGLLIVYGSWYLPENLKCVERIDLDGVVVWLYEVNK